MYCIPGKSIKKSCIKTGVYIFRNGEEMGFNPSVNICLLKDENKNNTWLNFDVLPEPLKATTVLCGTERFNSALSSAPLYGLITIITLAKMGSTG